MKTLGIGDLLDFHGFAFDKSRVKLVRHKHDKYPVLKLLEDGWLDLYQSYQGQPRFHKCDALVSFYGLSGTRSCFYGVFAVKGHRPADKGPTPAGCEHVRQWQQECSTFYELERIGGFKDLEHRLVIDWGKGALAWHQQFTNKPVLELLPAGRKLPIFDDYLEFRLSHRQLCDLFAHPESHRDWQSALQAVAGVYLILAEKTGDMYVGSAYGAGGIWGRWEQYAMTGHGGNKHLVELLRSDTDYPDGFTFSLLQILPKSFTMKEVIRREQLYKRKLGTRAKELHFN